MRTDLREIRNTRDPRAIHLDGLRPVIAVPAPMTAVPPRRRSVQASTKIFAIVVGVVVLCILAYLFIRSGSALSAAAASSKEVSELVSAVGAHMLLPTGETPVIATVSDPDVLKDQTFFKNAIVGDRVLMYTQASKAILYRPSEDKIIEVGPITAGQ